MAEDTGMSREWADKLAAAKIEREKSESEAALIRARSEEAKNLAEAKQRSLEAEAQGLRLKLSLEDEQEHRAGDKYHHIYYFTDMVSPGTVEKCMTMLDFWHRIDPGCDIKIIFNSPGGSVIDGMMLYDHIQTIRRQGHRVTTLALGMAASMAGILLQAGTVRQMGAEAFLLIHEVQTGVKGKVGEIEDEMKLLRKMLSRVVDIFVARSQEAADNGTATAPISRRKFEANWSRKDWWLDSDECLKYGFVDEVV